jgi:HAE1 family hydrophobic/amphiphilic exporter-1
MMGGHSTADIDVEVTGYDMDRILGLTDSVIAAMKKVRGLTDIRLSYTGVIPELRILPDRERLEHYGGSVTTVKSLGGAMLFNMTGNDDAVFREGGEDYPVRIQIAEEDRSTVDEVENMSIMTQKGLIPVKALADISYAGGLSSINRKNRQRMINVFANVSSGSSGEKVKELTPLIKNIPLQEGYTIGFGGFQVRMAESNKQLLIAGVLAVILTYMVLVAILESLMMSFVIWLTLPLGIIGVIAALFLAGKPFSMLSNMSIIMLIGIVVNNAILLIDYARRFRRERGLSAQEAIIESGRIKLKPIIMMNLAIVIAMVPQAMAFGVGGEIRAPFAITTVPPSGDLGGANVNFVQVLNSKPVCCYTISMCFCITA